MESGGDRMTTTGHLALQEEAVAWLVRRDSGEWTRDMQAQFDTWLAASTAHRVAFLRLEAGWEGASRLKALGAGRSRGAAPPPGTWHESPFFAASRPSAAPQPALTRPSQRRLWFASAAAVVLALGIIMYLRPSMPGDCYSTPIGGIASVPLGDGSNITLNTRTRVRVELGAKERRVSLDQGEAFFEVAKDPTRPFVVRAGDKRITAVGTEFSVRRNGDDVRVVVIEGTVRLETDGPPLHLQSAGTGADLGSAAPAAIPLTAGTLARATEQDLLVQSEPPPRAAEILSWRQGYLTFHDTSLGEALSEFNRYNVHQLSAADPQTAAIQISGMFRPTNYEAFVRLLQEGYSLKVQTSAERTVLSKE